MPFLQAKPLLVIQYYKLHTNLYCQQPLLHIFWFVHVKAVSEDEKDNCLQKDLNLERFTVR